MNSPLCEADRKNIRVGDASNDVHYGSFLLSPQVLKFRGGSSIADLLCSYIPLFVANHAVQTARRHAMNSSNKLRTKFNISQELSNWTDC